MSIVEAASAWTQADVGGPETWSLDVGAPADELAASLRRLLFDGPGFALIRGVAVAGPQADAEQALFGLGGLIGRPLAQDGNGTRIDAVRDERSAGVRGAKTNRSLPYHTDMAHLVPDVFMLLTVRPARTGGASLLASGHTAVNALARQDPARLAVLRERFDFDRAQDAAPGQSPVDSAPIVAHTGGGVRVRYNRARIHRGHRLSGRPLTDQARAALDALDETLAAQAHTLELFLEPGDVLAVNNHAILHSRTEFTDDPGGPGRLLLRHWIAASPGP